ncbi:MAG: helix-turn-helix transcriptional regulator [Treponema sp.]|nr:helix-turn-helix transcriptional regulator [Treponema sp.]
MGFWKNVEERRLYIGITRKDLATQSGIKYAIIGAGLERDSIPAANTALKIANALHTPLETLLDDFKAQQSPEDNKNEIYKKEEFLFKKYRDVIHDFEHIDISTRQIIIEMIHRFAMEKSAGNIQPGQNTCGGQ